MVNIEERHLRRESETNFEYGLRLIEDKIEGTSDVDWEEIIELLGLDIHRDTLRKMCQGSFGGYAVAKYFKEKMLDEAYDKEALESLLSEIEAKRLELEKEKIKYADQKREYKSFIKMDARFEHLRDSIIEEVRKINEVKPFLNSTQPRLSYGHREASLLLSDWHVGLEVKENLWNKYNLQVLAERVETLTCKTIKYCKDHNVEVLHMELLGDMINGYLHLSTRVYNEEDVIKQTMMCAEILAEMIKDLSKALPSIKVYSAIGNHGRCTANIKESIDTENFEYLIVWYLKARLEKLENVVFVDNELDEEIVVYDVFDEIIFSVHGHKDRPNTVIDDLSKMLKIFPTRIHMGHFHKHFETEDGGIIVSVNGCLSGTDQYAKGKRLYSKPHQKLVIFDRLEGELCTYKIKL